MEKKRISFIDVAVIIASAVIIVIALVFLLKINDNKLYLTKYVSETGVCYYITDSGIVPLYNPDGSLHIETISTNKGGK